MVSIDAGRGSPGQSREELWTLYKAAMDDRNFQVTLNWDRTKFYFLFNAALFSVAGGLGRIGGDVWATAAVFALTALNSFLAAHAIRKGHGYYRAARKRLKGVERELGLITDEADGAKFAVKTTRGMVRETEGQDRIPLGDRFTITNAGILLQMAIGAGALAGLCRLFL